MLRRPCTQEAEAGTSEAWDWSNNKQRWQVDFSVQEIVIEQGSKSYPFPHRLSALTWWLCSNNSIIITLNRCLLWALSAPFQIIFTFLFIESSLQSNVVLLLCPFYRGARTVILYQTILFKIIFLIILTFYTNSSLQHSLLLHMSQYFVLNNYCLH